MGPDKKRWWLFPRKQGNFRTRLFCFPHAGAGGVVYHPWSRQLPEFIQVVAAHPPGRGFRFQETPFTNINDYVDTYYTQILSYLDQPFAFFGHSMGTLVAYLLAQRLRDNGQPTPHTLFLSGRKAPHLPFTGPSLHSLPQAEFIAALEQRYGPDEALQNPDIAELVTPPLRADIKMIETFEYKAASPLSMPFVLMTGRDDAVATPEAMKAWEQHTTETCTLLQGLRANC